MDGITTSTAIVGSAIGVATLANAAWQYRRKLQLDIFRIYADRYNAIVPPEIYVKWRAALKGDRQHWTALNSTMISYLNLIWEESFLSREKVIHRGLWRHWLPEIRQVLSTDFAQAVAEENNFHFPPDLCPRPRGRQPAKNGRSTA